MSSNGKLARLGVSVAAVAAVLSFGAVGAAQAAPAVSATSGDVTVAADCTYEAIRNTVVRSGPGTQHPIVRTKKKGQHMTGPAPCIATGSWYKVYLSTGTYGYTPVADVRFVS